MTEILTPHVVRRLAGIPQIRVAVLAGTGVGTVRVYELEPTAVADRAKRRSLARVYDAMRAELVAGAH